MSENIFDKISEYGIVPLVTLDDANDAVPLAQALVKGGIPIAEVTFRTAAGGESIKRMAKEVPEIMVGAGTVHDIDHAKETVDNGGKFIITPGFNRKVVEWCVNHDVPVCPGTVVPSDLEDALDCGLRVVKFFPAGAYGGVNTLKALAGPYAQLKFVPTGGVNLDNMCDFLDLPNVAAVGGSFVPPSKLVKAKDWDGIAAECRRIMNLVFDFSVGHVGINAGTADNATNVSNALAAMFDVESRDAGSAYFVGDLAEVMKVPFVGSNGHICVDTRDLRRALALMARKGIKLDEKNVIRDAKGNIIAAYLEGEVGGFAVHLRQRPKK
ncbi:MAG: bifunctional 4-hydroxy-2-oxoglutarate aldolase/2-dehydro-3-deoxy-phosphogluconate aldolase [Candidatus Anaerobiospirillum merdipullorum]|uniref:2-dehydro-3-deoxy-phosphogluconate aldolase n=1 Tax=Candidatus Anaerobiospirillum merdipullorum TaxID=2838450 RepID=A0A9E2NRT4_9GAMM|nr:bifunctional 4-hydroxy-2-oxoglutarate aldolase/2-dehydro-3-deoxy-phosphogluconate aldolase [Candidatus Anaerobiospirillum merdipullorum]